MPQAIAALVAGVALCIVGCAPAPPSSSPSAPGRTTPAPPIHSARPTAAGSATAAPTPGLATDPWRRVDFAADDADSIAAAGGRFVCVGHVGYDEATDDPLPAATWTSPDGISWTRGDSLDAGASAGGEGIVLASTPAGLVAFARQTLDFSARLWTSADGRHWRRAPDQASLTPTSRVFSEGRTDLWDAAGSEAGFLVIGAVAGQCGDDGCVAGHEHLWRSADGLVWRREALPKGVDHVAHVAPYAGGWVAWGRSDAAGSRVGTSPDGRTWRWTTTDVDVSALVGVRPDLLVAIGSAPGISSAAEVPVILRSSDGRTWERAGHLPAAMGDTSLAMVDLATDGTTVVYLDTGRPARGLDERPVRRPVVWASRDGDRWEALPSPPGWTAETGAKLSTVAVNGSRVAVLGTWTPGAGADPWSSVWVLDLAARP